MLANFGIGALAGLARGLHRVAAAAADQRGVLSDRLRSADKIALHRIAALVREERELLLGFHALGDDRHLQAVAQADHGPNDRRRLVIASEIHDESAVDLDFVEWKRLKVAQRRITTAEVIHGNTNAERLQPPQQRQTAIEILDQHAFSDFQLKPARRETGFEKYRM